MKSFQWLVRFFAAATLMAGMGAQIQIGQGAGAAQPNCRFGITVPNGMDETNGASELQTLQVGGFLDWGTDQPNDLPAGVDFVNVLRVRADLYPTTLSGLPTLISTRPKGEYWEVGNEPDTSYEDQDNVTAEVYADDFFALATVIRIQDPSAKIGFGTVVQPTPIRMRYLDKAWTELIKQAGSKQAASGLIDFWNIHSFILNEVPGQWGTGAPPGFENDHGDAVAIANFAQTYSSAVFAQRVQAFRSWMASKGEQNKPLWITEYGSLFPSVYDPQTNLVTVSDSLTANFMTATFNFMLNTTNTTSGMPDDAYHLVQRWFWYSLNGDRKKMGGSLYIYDPSNQDAITTVGSTFIKDISKLSVAPDYAIEQASVQPDADDGNQFELNFKLKDTGNNTAPAGVKISVYADNPSGTPVATYSTPTLSGCGETRTFSEDLPYIATATGKLYIEADTSGDTNPANNWSVVDAPPNTAIHLSATARSTNKMVLQWSQNGTGDSWYEVQRSADGSSGWTATGGPLHSLTTYTDEGGSLAAGTPYYYRVRIVKNGIEWGASNVALDTTQASGAVPPVPQAANARIISNRTISLTWASKYDNTQYYVERSKDGIQWTVLPVVNGVDTPPYTTVLTDRGLDIDQNYFYRVRAWNASGFSAYSTVVSAKTYRYGGYLPLFR